jgi:hypothetical protein
MTYSFQSWGDLQIYSVVIFHETRHYAQAHVTWRTYALCPFSDHEMNRDGSGVWWMILLATVGYGGS